GGYKDALATSEDWELYVRIARRHAVERIPEVVVKIRSHYGPRLGDRLEEALGVERIVLQEHGDMMDARLRSFYLQKIGGKLARIGRLDAARTEMRRAIRLNPANLRAYAQYALSFCGSRMYRRAHHLYKQYS